MSPMDRGPAPARVTAVAAPPSGPGSTAQMLAILKDCLYPSQREAVAEALGGRDWHREPQIVDALVKAIKEDPAPMVRAECARSLGRLGANTVPAVAACEALKNDADARVRKEAEQALLALKGDGAGNDGAVRTTSGTMPK
jgi:hypothetical protein